MNLLTACSHANLFWRYSKIENKSKSSIICMFYFKSMETDARRVNNWKAQGPRLANYSCLAAARWADDAKACACVVKCLFRGGDAACFRTATAWRRNIFYGKT